MSQVFFSPPFTGIVRLFESLAFVSLSSRRFYRFSVRIGGLCDASWVLLSCAEPFVMAFSPMLGWLWSIGGKGGLGWLWSMGGESIFCKYNIKLARSGWALEWYFNESLLSTCVSSCIISVFWLVWYAKILTTIKCFWPLLDRSQEWTIVLFCSLSPWFSPYPCPTATPFHLALRGRGTHQSFDLCYYVKFMVTLPSHWGIMS